MTELTLYHGAEAIIAELETDPETGEIGTGVNLDVLVSKNPVGCVAYALHQRARIKMIKTRINELSWMQKACERNEERVITKLKQAMKLTGTKSIRAQDGTFGAVLSEDCVTSVEIMDERQIPMAYMREIPARFEPDKVMIEAAIEGGVDVPGARIVKRDRLTLK